MGGLSADRYVRRVGEAMKSDTQSAAVRRPSVRAEERKSVLATDRWDGIWVHLFIFAATLLVAIVVRSYRFGTNDHVGQLVIHYRMFDPTYLVNDWYLNWNNEFSYRHAYGYLAGTLAQVVGWETAYFIMFVLTWFLIFDGIVRIAEVVTGDRRIGYIAAMLIIAVLTTNVLGKTIWARVAVARELARAFAVMGLSVLLIDKWVIGGALLGAAASMHVLTGGEPIALFGAAIVIEAILGGRFDRKMLKAIISGGIACAVVAAPVILSIAKTIFFPEKGNVDLELAALIAGVVRDAHHTIPSEMPRMRYISFARDLAAIAFVVATWRPSMSPSQSLAFRRLGWVVAVTLVAMIVSVFFTQVILVPAIATATILMNSFWIHVIAAICMAIIFAETYAKRRPMWIAAAIVTFVSIAGVSLVEAYSPITYLTHLMTLVFLPVVAYGLLNPKCCETLIGRARIGVIGIAAITALLFVGSYYLRDRPPAVNSRWYPAWWHYTNEIAYTFPPLAPGEQELVSWVDTETPRDAVFVIPPTESWFRLRAARAISFEWSSVPYQSAATIDWFHRLQALTGDTTSAARWHGGKSGRDAIEAKYDALPRDSQIQVAHEFGAQYVVRRRGTSPDGVPVVFRGSQFEVYRVPGESQVEHYTSHAVAR